MISKCCKNTVLYVHWWTSEIKIMEGMDIEHRYRLQQLPFHSKVEHDGVLMVMVVMVLMVVMVVIVGIIYSDYAGDYAGDLWG